MGRSILVLFLGRLVQGASSAVVHTIGMAILADTVGDAEIGTAMGLVTLNTAAGVLAGPVLGGIIYDQQGYFAVFMSAYALIAVDFILRIVMVERPLAVSEYEVLKAEGQTYGTVRNVSRDAPEITPNHPSVPGTIPESPLLSNQYLANGVFSQRRRHPALVLLSIPRMRVALLGALIQTSILLGLESTIPLRVKTIFHCNSTQVAFIFLWITIPALVAPLMGHLASRCGSRIIISLGFLCLTPCLILLRMINHNDSAQVFLVCLLLLLIGLSMHMIMTPISAEAKRLIDETEAAQPGTFGTKGPYAQAFGLLNAASASGSLIGPLAGGFLLERVGWNSLTLGSGIFSASCVVPCFLALGKRRIRDRAMDMVEDNR